MLHKHQFVYVCETEKPKVHGLSIHSTIVGAIYSCMDLECTEVRIVWTDGVKEVLREGLPDKEE